MTSGTLGGGALLPAWEGASGLWSEFLRAYHPTGIGSASPGPPYVGFLALVATILLGKAWLAIDVLLLGCVPLAGVTAFLALRRVTKSVAIRVWAAASYALLPIAFGAISAGRLGSAVAFVLIPLIGLLAGRMFSQPPKLARRAAWATGLAVTVGAAFVPLLWPMAVVGAVAAALGRAAVGADAAAQPGHRRADAARSAAAVADPAARAPHGAASGGRDPAARPGVGQPAGPVAAAAEPRRAWPARVLGERGAAAGWAGRAAGVEAAAADRVRLARWRCSGSPPRCSPAA